MIWQGSYSNFRFFCMGISLMVGFVQLCPSTYHIIVTFWLCVSPSVGPVGDPGWLWSSASRGGPLQCGGGHWRGGAELCQVCPQPVHRGKESEVCVCVCTHAFVSACLHGRTNMCLHGHGSVCVRLCVNHLILRRVCVCFRSWWRPCCARDPSVTPMSVPGVERRGPCLHLATCLCE